MKYRQVEMRQQGHGPFAQRVEMERVVETPDNYYPDAWRVDDSAETYDWRPLESIGAPYRGEPHPAFAKNPEDANNPASERQAVSPAVSSPEPPTANPAPHPTTAEGA